MTKLKIEARNFDKWASQNKAEYTGEFFAGSMLDNFIISTKRGFAAVYERYVNSWASCYEVHFVPYKSVKEVDTLFADFMTRQEESEA